MTSCLFSGQKISSFICSSWTRGHPVSFQLWQNENFGRSEAVLDDTYDPQCWSHGAKNQTKESHSSLKNYSVSHLRKNVRKELQPVLLSSHLLCIVIFLFNLARAEWICVNCNKRLTDDIVCHKDKLSSPHDSKHKTPSQNICNEQAVKKEKVCFSFIWYEGNYSLTKDILNICGHKFGMTTDPLIQTHKLHVTLNAMTHHIFALITPVSSSLSLVKQHLFDRIWFETFWKSSFMNASEAKGFLVCTGQTTKQRQPWSSLQMLQWRVHIQRICAGWNQ